MSKRAILDLNLRKDDRTDVPSLNLRKKIKIETRLHHLKN